MLFSKKNKEIENRITRLREKYKEFGNKFGNNIFNYNAFENRLENTLKNRINLEIFVKAEEEALSQLYNETISPKKKEKLSEKEDSYTKKVDKILKEYEERIKKYPKIDFYDYEDEEIKYLYGAIVFFYEKIFPYLETIFNGRELGMNIMKDFSVFYNYLNYYGRETTRGHSKRIEDFILKLKYSSKNEIEVDYRNFFIETAKYFNNLKQFLRTNLNKLKDIKKIINVENKLFEHNQYTFYDLTKRIISWIDDLMYDFRLSEFS